MAGTNKLKNHINGGPAIILIKPQLGENIGTAARAMYNFGLNDLRIVSPREKWPNKKANAASAGALEILGDNVKIYNNTNDAIADLNYLLATSVRERELNKEVISPKESAKIINKKIKNKFKTGILFGPEKAGLINDDIVNADAIIRIPTNSSFGSINLAMAVNVVSYEYICNLNYRYDNKKEKVISSKKSDLEFFFTRLFKVLKRKNFLAIPEKEATMKRNIRAIFTRCNLSDRELSTLHGVISSLIKSEKNNNIN